MSTISVNCHQTWNCIICSRGYILISRANCSNCNCCPVCWITLAWVRMLTTVSILRAGEDQTIGSNRHSIANVEGMVGDSKDHITRRCIICSCSWSEMLTTITPSITNSTSDCRYKCVCILLTSWRYTNVDWNCIYSSIYNYNTSFINRVGIAWIWMVRCITILTAGEGYTVCCNTDLLTNIQSMIRNCESHYTRRCSISCSCRSKFLPPHCTRSTVDS